MKQLAPFISQLTGLAVVGMALGYAPIATAETLPGPGPFITALIEPAALARLSADLAYPNSSQRFFEEGNARLEAEIRQLSDADEPSEPVLTIRPEILEKLQQPE